MALDAGAEELGEVRDTFGAMKVAGELPPDTGAAQVQADARRLPFADGAFDRVIASEVLEHIEEDSAAMRELARVLRRGGTMAVTVPRCGPELVNWLLSERYHDVPGGHVRIYRRSTLRTRLGRAGLRTTASHHAHALHSPYWWLRCLVGTGNDDNRLVAAYHRVLVWDIVKAPRATRVAERVLNPLIGKSLVLYLHKPAKGAAQAPPAPARRLPVTSPEPVGGPRRPEKDEAA